VLKYRVVSKKDVLKQLIEDADKLETWFICRILFRYVDPVGYEKPS